MGFVFDANTSGAAPANHTAITMIGASLFMETKRCVRMALLPADAAAPSCQAKQVAPTTDVTRELRATIVIVFEAGKDLVLVSYAVAYPRCILHNDARRRNGPEILFDATLVPIFRAYQGCRFRRGLLE